MSSSASLPGQLPIPALRAEFDSRLIIPDDAGYDAARSTFYAGYDRRPAAIIRAADSREVARVVRLARESGLPFAIRSGGHSAAAHGVCDDGIVLDLSGMHIVDVDAARRVAWTQPGATAHAYSVAAATHGLGTGFGDAGTVGVAGITLGGGIGYLSRKHGLTIDSLVSAEIVTADGATVTCDEEQHPDLFWAIRGGGGNFGVATRLQLRLHDVSSFVGGILILPATSETIHAFVAESSSAPEELSTIVNVMPAPPMPFLAPEHHGKLVVMAFMAYAGDVEAGQRVMGRFRAIAPPLADMVRPMSYPEIFPPEDGSYHPLATGRTMYVDAVDRTMTDTIVDRLERSSAYMAVTQIRVLGGAIARVPDEATAYAHRSRRIMMNVAALYQRPEEKAEHEAWVTATVAALKAPDTAAYVNFVADEGAARVRDAYPSATWERLRAIKRRYDPDNLFRLNQNIPPAEPTA